MRLAEFARGSRWRERLQDGRHRIPIVKNIFLFVCFVYFVLCVITGTQANTGHVANLKIMKKLMCQSYSYINFKCQQANMTKTFILVWH